VSQKLPPLPPHELRPFLNGVQADPDDDLAIRALADWLEEIADPRAELVRAGLSGDVSTVARWVGKHGKAWWGWLPWGVHLEVRRGLIELVWPTAQLGAAKPGLSDGLTEMLEQGWVFCVVLDGPAERPLSDWSADLLRHVTAIRWEMGSDAGLSRLPPLPMLRELDLGKSVAVSSAGLAHLTRFPGLWRLRLSGCDALWSVSLGDFAELRQLRLAWNPRMTDVSLFSLPELSTLSLAMSDQFRTLQLTNVPTMREVLLRGCAQLTHGDLVPLSGLASLESLDLTGCVRLTGAGLAHLNGLPRLRELILNGCTALERVQLGSLPALRVLDLSNTRIRQLELNGLPALEQLDLHGNRLGNARLNAISASLPQGCRLRV
jgi:uncharacterized protein (TIGR02996 family)